MSFDRDFKWQEQFLPQMQRILAESLWDRLFRVAPLTEDMRHNTDMMTLFAGEIRVACRVRKEASAGNFRGEFTLRASRPSGVDTELQKLIAGWGNYIFYGVAHDHTPTLRRWVLGDLNVFRRYHAESLMRNGGQAPGKLIENRDGSSSFRAYRVADLPSDFVIARSGTADAEQRGAA